MTHRKIAVSIFVIAAGLGSINPARAQVAAADPGNAGTTVMDQVIVQSVMAPTANAIADRQQIELQAAPSSVLNTIKYLPGVNLSQGDAFGGDDWSTHITIRSFNDGQLGFTIDGVGTGFTEYAGGVKPNRYVDIENLQSVVVSQGAADISSASAQALGGTLAYYTNDPHMGPGLEATFTGGSFDTTRYFLRADTGPFGGNNSAYISFSSEQNDNWVGHFVGGNAAVTNRIHMDAKDVGQFGNLKVTLYATIDNVDPEINYQGVTLQQFAADPRNDQLTFTFTGKPVIDQNYAPTWTTIRTNSLVYAKTEAPITPDLDFSFQPYWAHQQGKGEFLPPYQIRRYDLAGNPSTEGNYVPANEQGTIFFGNGSGQDISPVNPATGVAATNPYDISTYTWLTPAQQAAAVALSSARFSRYQDNRYGDNLSFELKLGEENKVHFGMWNEDQQRQRFRTWQAVDDSAVSDAYDSVDYSETFHWKYHTYTNMFYVADQFTTGNWVVDAGLKYYNVDIAADELLLQADGTPGYSTSLKSNSDILPSAGVIYKLDPASELFASFTSNFSAVQDTVLEAGATGVDVSNVKPEKADNYDFGYRYASPKFAFSATGYYIDYTDKIVSLSGLAAKDYTNTSSGVYVNIGGTESYGTELAANYRIAPGLNFVGSFSYTHSEYTASTPDGTITKGATVVDTPKYIASYGLQYDRNGFSSGLMAKSVSSRFGTYSNDNEAPGYTTVDLTVGYRRQLDQRQFFKSFSVGLGIVNLLDKDYLGAVSTNDQGYVKNDPTGTIMLWNIGAPRTITFSVGLEF
jgi:iron complex outermembrane receptor protein